MPNRGLPPQNMWKFLYFHRGTFHFARNKLRAYPLIYCCGFWAEDPETRVSTLPLLLDGRGCYIWMRDRGQAITWPAALPYFCLLWKLDD